MILIAAMVVAPQLSAAPLEWRFNDVTFDDGTMLTGGFIYDWDQGSLISANIRTTTLKTTGLEDGLVYAYDLENSTDSIEIINTDGFELCVDNHLAGGCERLLEMYHFTPLIGDVVSIDAYDMFISETLTNYPYDYFFGAETRYVSHYRNVVSGSLDLVAPTVVPVPAAAWLFGSGLVGLIGVARRKARA